MSQLDIRLLMRQLTFYWDWRMEELVSLFRFATVRKEVLNWLT